GDIGERGHTRRPRIHEKADRKNIELLCENLGENRQNSPTAKGSDFRSHHRLSRERLAAIPSRTNNSLTNFHLPRRREEKPAPAANRKRAIRTNMNAIIQSATERNINSLDLLFDRATTLAARARDGSLPFIEAVDMAYSAADWAGLVDRYGDDAVQQTL